MFSGRISAENEENILFIRILDERWFTLKLLFASWGRVSKNTVGVSDRLGPSPEQNHSGGYLGN